MFGELRLRGPDGADVTPRGRKARAMIAWLSRCPSRSAGRDRIVGLFWGERGEEQARASLRQSLADLKDTAPLVAEMIRADRMEIALQPGWTSDLAALEAAIAAGDAAALAPILDVIQGELLADLAGLSAAFDEWRMAEQARLEQLLQDGALPLAEMAAATAPRAARAIVNGLQRLLEGNEDVVRLGMKLDDAAGDLASVHRRYRTLEVVLRREFDVTPSPATKRLMAELAANALAPPAAPPAGGGNGGAAPIIVISPFAVLGGDTDSAALVNVLCLDLQSALARLPDLRVLRHSDTGSMPHEDLLRSAIAGYSLAGSIRPSAKGMRLNMTLAEIASGRTLWSHQQEAVQNRLGEAIDSAVEKVAAAVLPTLERDLVSTRRLEAAAPDAYALYLRARLMLLTVSSFAEAEEAGQLLEKALELNPGFTNARLHLLLCYNTDFLQRVAGNDPAPWRRRALRLAEEALRLDAENPEVVARLGWCHLRNGDWGRAAGLFHEVAENGYGHADNMQLCGLGLLLTGDVDAGRELLARAIHLNPFPRSDYFADDALRMLLEGDFNGAAQQFEFAADRSIQYLAMEAASLGLCGRRERAAERLQQVRRNLSAIWQGAAQPTDEDVPEMMQRFLPLRKETHRAMLAEGWRLAGLQCDPARARSST